MADLDAMYAEANELKEQGDLEAAVAKLEELVNIDENYTLAHAALAVHLQRLGKNEDAIAHATKVTKLEPTDSFSFTQLSVICQRCGLIPEAEAAMAQAQQIQMGGG